MTFLGSAKRMGKGKGKGKVKIDGSAARRRSRLAGTAVVAVLIAIVAVRFTRAGAAADRAAILNDSHFHLTDYVQKGTDIRDFLNIMGGEVGRVALFGIPLQQEWSFRISGDDAPTYYLDTDAPLYYYSFEDAFIAKAVQSLPAAQRARLDPMITGFNPADMYAADHVRRVLETFPGVFSGIGEFTIHKEFVSSKISGSVPSLTDPALDRLLAFAAEVGLVVLIHNDVDAPFAKAGAEPVHLAQMKALLRRHPGNPIIWAHVGVGRVVHPVANHAAMVETIVQDPGLAHVHFDLSWAETAKYLVASPETTRRAAALINRYPDRFLFGTDEVAPRDQQTYLRVYRQYEPLWRLLDAAASEKVRRLNYQRLFDAARVKVRAWERANVTTGGGPRRAP